MEDRDSVVIFAGDIGTRKGIDILARAWNGLALAESDGWRLRLFGKPSLEDPVSTGLLADELIESEFLEHPQLLAALATASVFVLPSRAEAFPMAVCEAMANGCAVVATDVGGVREILGRETPFLISAGDAHELETALRTLLHDEQARIREGTRNRCRAEDFLDSTVVTRTWELVYEAVVEGVSAPSVP
jgi:glycosyltransferase involved in cell wall biosynthesis